MKKIYNISKGQVITLWVFFGILWIVSALGVFIDFSSSYISPKEMGLFHFLLLGFWLIPFLLVFCTLGWKNNKNKDNF